MTLWNRFNELLPEPTEDSSAPIIETKEDVPISVEPANEAPATARKSISSHCVHFNILSTKWQYKIFINGAQALALCEYGESWRTNLIKRCGFNDVVFLYKSGGPGYVGCSVCCYPGNIAQLARGERGSQSRKKQQCHHCAGLE